MKLKLILLSFLLFSKPIFATMDAYIFSYIPIVNQEADLSKEDGIMLHKALFYTYYSQPEAIIGAVTWKYQVNTPHKNKDAIDLTHQANLAHIEGLEVKLDNHEKGCTITIDSRKIDTDNRYSKSLEKILFYVKKATHLNMKEAKIDCEIQELKAPKKKIVLKMPQPLDLLKASLTTFKDFKLIGYDDKYPFVADTFYPLGYSQDGKFAYVIEYDRDPADIVDIEVYIQDLVTDKILWKNSFREEQRAVDFKIFWKERSELIASKLKQYHINYQSTPKWEEGSVFYRNDTFTLDAISKKEYFKEWNLAFLSSSKILIGSKSKGSKIIDKKSYKNPSYILSRKPMGMLNFDNGKRRAVIVGKVSRGWEGPPHNLAIEVVGVNLDVGFLE